MSYEEVNPEVLRLSNRAFSGILFGLMLIGVCAGYSLGFLLYLSIKPISVYYFSFEPKMIQYDRLNISIPVTLILIQLYQSYALSSPIREHYNVISSLVKKFWLTGFLLAISAHLLIYANPIFYLSILGSLAILIHLLSWAEKKLDDAIRPKQRLNNKNHPYLHLLMVYIPIKYSVFFLFYLLSWLVMIVTRFIRMKDEPRCNKCDVHECQYKTHDRPFHLTQGFPQSENTTRETSIEQVKSWPKLNSPLYSLCSVTFMDNSHEVILLPSWFSIKKLKERGCTLSQNVRGCKQKCGKTRVNYDFAIIGLWGNETFLVLKNLLEQVDNILVISDNDKQKIQKYTITKGWWRRLRHPPKRLNISGNLEQIHVTISIDIISDPKARIWVGDYHEIIVVPPLIHEGSSKKRSQEEFLLSRLNQIVKVEEQDQITQNLSQWPWEAVAWWKILTRLTIFFHPDTLLRNNLILDVCKWGSSWRRLFLRPLDDQLDVDIVQKNLIIFPGSKNQNSTINGCITRDKFSTLIKDTLP